MILTFLSGILTILLAFVVYVLKVVISGVLWDSIKNLMKERSVFDKCIYLLLTIVIAFVGEKKQEELFKEINAEVEYLLSEKEYLEAINLALSLLWNIPNLGRVTGFSSQLKQGIWQIVKMKGKFQRFLPHSTIFYKKDTFEKDTFHILPTLQGGWYITRNDSPVILKRLRTKKEALDWARNKLVSEIII